MASLKRAEHEPKTQLWDVLDDVHAVMLGSGQGDHLQPMSPFPVRDENTIWFFANRNTDIVTGAMRDPMVHMTVVSKNHDYHACLRGKLSVQTSKSHIERFWSPIVGAWFDGIDDPKLCLLAFRPYDASVWASSSSGMRFGWEILKSNLTTEDPKIGVSRHLELASVSG